jgi:hypothetical protein
MVYCLPGTGRLRFRAAVLIPDMFRMAYCAVVELIAVAELVPAVLTSVTSAIVIGTDNAPAMAISKYCVRPLLT